MTHASPTAAVPPLARSEHDMPRLGLAYGRLVYRLRWPIIVAWVVALIASVPFAATLSTVLKGGGLELRQSESSYVTDVLVARLQQPRSAAVIVFQSSGVPVSAPAYQAELAAFEARARAFSHVVSVTPGAVGQDGRTTFVTVGFDRDESYQEQRIPALRELLPTSPAHAYVTGQAAANVDILTAAQNDLEQREALALPVALVVLIFVFASLVAAAMPLVLALVAVPVALAVIYAIAVHFDTTIFVLNVASVVGLGISIDYSLLMTRRFREELEADPDVRQAVARTVATTGEAILFSGLTVMVGLSGLLLIGVQMLVSFGLGGAVVVGVAVLAALTLMPALLAVLGQRLNALRVPLLGRQARGASGTEGARGRRGFWHPLALGVMRRPVLIVVAVTVWLLVLGQPITSMSVALFGAAELPPTAEAQHGQDLLRTQFPHLFLNPIEVVAQTPDGSSMLTPDALARVANLTTWLAGQPHVTGAIGLMQVLAQPGQPPLGESQLATLYTSGAYARSPALAQLVAGTTAGDTTLIILNTDTRLDSDVGKALIDHLRAGDAAAGRGLRVAIGGTQAESLDLTRYIYGNFSHTILLILIATYLLLLLMFRSLLLPLKAVLMNVLSLSAAYGVLVYVFQWGHFQRLLGFTSNGFLNAPAPILIFCILFGLSMDYEVFLLSRVREEWLRTGDNREAVARGLEKTGGIITSAALLFVVITGAFALTRLETTKEFGVGMSVSVLVDASVIRILLVPATMRLLGRWNWWLPGQPLPIGASRVRVPVAPATSVAPVAPVAPVATFASAVAIRERIPGSPLAAPLPGLDGYLVAESERLHWLHGLPLASVREGRRSAAHQPLSLISQVYLVPLEEQMEQDAVDHGVAVPAR